MEEILDILLRTSEKEISLWPFVNSGKYGSEKIFLKWILRTETMIESSRIGIHCNVPGRVVDVGLGLVQCDRTITPD